VLFRPDEDNKHYEYHPSKLRKNVLSLGNAGFDACIKDIEKQIGGTQVIIDQLNSRLGIAAKVEDEEHGEEDDEVNKKYKEREQKKVQLELEEAQDAIETLQIFLVNVKRDWQKPENRVIGHVVLSPPISLSAGEEGYTED
jgi:hypothetical protein